MGKIDILAKKYLSDNARFADVFNFQIYGGKAVIRADALRPLDAEEIAVPYGNNAQTTFERFRDLLKGWILMSDGIAAYAILGIENQTRVHYAMPVRNMLYDSMNYAGQVTEAAKTYRDKENIEISSEEFLSGFRKEDRLLPVITLVFYLGADD